MQPLLRALGPALGCAFLLHSPAAGQDPTAPATTFRAERGAITSSGVYLAPEEPGRDVVLTTTGVFTDTAVVEVTAPAPIEAGAPTDARPPALTDARTPPPTPRDAPVPANGLWLDEDFSRYTSIDQLLSNPLGQLTNPSKWPGWYHTKDITLAPGEGYDGSRQSVRYEWPVARCKRDYQISLEYKPPPQREFWAEVAVKFATTFTTSESECGGSAYKMIFFFLPDSAGHPGGRFDLVNGNNGSIWRASNPETPPFASGSACEKGNNRHCRVDALNNLNGDPPTFNRRWDGQWHLYRFHIALSSCPTCPDGAYEIWTDNPKAGGAMVRVDSRRNLVAVDSRTRVYADRIARITLGGNLNRGPSQPGARVWWGRLRIWTKDPGW